MEYLTLNNGIRMPLAGFGTFMLGGEACTDAVAAAIRRISGRISPCSALRCPPKKWRSFPRWTEKPLSSATRKHRSWWNFR